MKVTRILTYNKKNMMYSIDNKEFGKDYPKLSELNILRVTINGDAYEADSIAVEESDGVEHLLIKVAIAAHLVDWQNLARYISQEDVCCGISFEIEDINY